MSWKEILKSVRVTANAIVEELNRLGFIAKVDYVDPVFEGLGDSFSISVYKNKDLKGLSVVKYMAIANQFWVSEFGEQKEGSGFHKVDSVNDVIDFYESRLGDVA
tara:strand:- start:1331 stop:1645 length:315 start_codon:yes stop_codon:yes gene_type:complete